MEMFYKLLALLYRVKGKGKMSRSHKEKAREEEKK